MLFKFTFFKVDYVHRRVLKQISQYAGGNSEKEAYTEFEDFKKLFGTDIKTYYKSHGFNELLILNCKTGEEHLVNL